MDGYAWVLYEGQDVWHEINEATGEATCGTSGGRVVSGPKPDYRWNADKVCMRCLQTRINQSNIRIAEAKVAHEARAAAIKETIVNAMRQEGARAAIEAMLSGLLLTARGLNISEDQLRAICEEAIQMVYRTDVVGGLRAAIDSPEGAPLREALNIDGATFDNILAAGEPHACPGCCQHEEAYKAMKDYPPADELLEMTLSELAKYPPVECLRCGELVFNGEAHRAGAIAVGLVVVEE